jgi:serine/threonine protein kinase/Flp pilus assembly protein TadD
MNRDLETNTSLSHYRILSKLGAGGMGEVYLAQDTKLDRKVALKILPEEFAADRDRMSRFVREAKSASALNHPNIITIYEIGESEGTHFIATEFIEGQTLSVYSRSNPLKLKTVLEIAIQLASALDEAHSAGIVHRDIKPDNVMLRPNGLVKILDFGIAKLSERMVTGRSGDGATGGNEVETLISESPRLPVALSPNPVTSPGMIIGTANYMSPEQAKGKEVDTRTDIFSFGVVLYEMTAGVLPFDGETPVEMIGAIFHKEPKQLPVTVPGELKRIIQKCLRKDRDERYQTVRDVLNDLKDVKQDLELQQNLDRTVAPGSEEAGTQILKATTVDESSRSTTNKTNARSSTKKFGAIAGVILVVSLFGFFGYRYLRSSSNQIQSIAVLPFVNEGGDQNVEYLSDGMTETLIKSLANLPNLSVKPRSSVFRYKGKDTDLKTIAQELNVQAILNGRVAQRGDDLTLSLELVDVRKDSVIWTERYQRKTSDLIALQGDIARDVSNKLKTKLSGAEETKVTKAGTSDTDAYQAYLKGRFYWNRRSSENLKKALEQFKAATERDPNYALAYVGLADCYVVATEYTGVPSTETLPKAKAFADRAIAIDDQLAEPHATLGQINSQLWRWSEAEAEFKRAIELNPNYATAYHWYSIMLKDMNRKDEAATAIKRAQELDPLSMPIGANISMLYQLQNNHEASVKNSLKLIELDPTYGRSYEYLGLSYLKLGRKAEAIAALEKAVQLTNNQNVVVSELGYVYAASGKRTEALAVLKDLEAKYARKEAAGIDVASVYAGLGEKDKAFQWLEKDFQNRDGRLITFRWEQQFESLIDDPRFKDLLKRMNLPE